MKRLMFLSVTQSMTKLLFHSRNTSTVMNVLNWLITSFAIVDRFKQNKNLKNTLKILVLKKETVTLEDIK